MGLWVEGGPIKRIMPYSESILHTWTFAIFKKSEMEPSAAIKSLLRHIFSGTVHKNSSLRSNGQNLQNEMPKKFTFTELGSKTEVENLPNIEV